MVTLTLWRQASGKVTTEVPILGHRYDSAGQCQKQILDLLALGTDLGHRGQSSGERVNWSPSTTRHEVKPYVLLTQVASLAGALGTNARIGWPVVRILTE